VGNSFHYQIPFPELFEWVLDRIECMKREENQITTNFS
jgi:hypothetical protein